MCNSHVSLQLSRPSRLLDQN
jgi:protein transport protein DSL1/ZW10